MRIATRVTLLFVLLTLLVSSTVGWFAVAMSSRAQYATLDSSINAVVDSGQRNPNTALNNALYVVQRDGYDLTLDVIDPSGGITQVNTPTGALKRHPTITDVKASLSRVIGVADLPGYEIRSLNVGGGDYLVVAGSTSGINKQNEHLALLVASAAVIIVLLGLILARGVMHRDLRSMERLIDYAGDVAGGDETGPAPPSEGSRDLKELRGALVIMVAALQQRIALEAQNANVMQQFIDDASHELRTPLTVVKGYNELLASGHASPEQQVRAVTRMQREVERMEGLVRDLLLLAELREAPHHAERLVDLSELLKTRVGEFALEHPERELTSEIEPGVTIHARADFVDRLLNNAFVNVLRHTKSDVTLRVTLDALGREASLVIEDGGPGLPLYGVRPQRFQRFDDSRSRETGGSGLGMSIMADVAESLGGAMTTAPSSLGGLALRFVIPIAASVKSGSDG
ncbi:MAG TPA: histidine kinase dimerization/phospho-acceptor domain-containing protein [Acidimicrobiales bacterium]|nr:histidine kinase dimerization/phospho-acceptor domain-containing protein [Acidimicrobiales bacterium]